MTKILKAFLGCLFATVPLSAGAATTAAEKSETKWEVNGGTTFGLDITTQKGQDSTKTWVFQTKTGYYIVPQIQIGADLTYYHYSFSSSTSGHYFAALVGPTFDFLPDAERSPYVFAGIGQGMSGFNYTTSGGSTTSYSMNQFAYEFGVGTRVPLADHVSWSPQIQYIALDSAEDGSITVRASHDWNFLLIRFSALF